MLWKEIKKRRTQQTQRGQALLCRYRFGSRSSLHTYYIIRLKVKNIFIYLVVSIIIPTFAAPKLNLMHNNMSNIESTKGEIVMYQPDETIRLEVRMGEDTVWLTQQQMADLFATDRTSIAKHIQNIYQTDELEKEPTCAKIAQVRQEGKRKVKRSILIRAFDLEDSGFVFLGRALDSGRASRRWYQ